MALEFKDSGVPRLAGRFETKFERAPDRYLTVALVLCMAAILGCLLLAAAL
jgi:hypothetical protein